MSTTQTTTPAGDDAAVDAMARLIAQRHDIAYDDARWCVKRDCDDDAKYYIAGIREGRVPGIVEFCNGYGDPRSQIDGMAMEIAALREKLAAAGCDLVTWCERHGRAVQERDAAIARADALQSELDTERSDRDRIGKKWEALCDKNNDENAALQARVVEQADVISMHERDLSLCIDERNAAQAEVARLTKERDKAVSDHGEALRLHAGDKEKMGNRIAHLLALLERIREYARQSGNDILNDEVTAAIEGKVS